MFWRMNPQQIVATFVLVFANAIIPTTYYAASATTSSAACGSRHPTTDTTLDSTRLFYNGINYELSSNEVDPCFCDPNSPLSFSGYFGVRGSEYDTTKDKKYFYWFFEKRSKSVLPDDESTSDEDDAIPLLIWLNGGPGCSSSLGLLMENGPCLVNSDGTSTSINPYSWTESAHVLFLDQPAGVGYSYGETNDKNEDMIAEDAFFFLQSFFQNEKGSKYSKSPLFLTGESYAGHYIPSIGHRIWMGNQNHDQSGLLFLQLSGLAIGNGFISPEIQYNYYADMAYNNSHGLRIIDEETYFQMKADQAVCITKIHECNQGIRPDNSIICQSADYFCSEKMIMPIDEKGLSVYDISKNCTFPPLCEDMTAIESFLNLDSTKEALHVPLDIHWEPCTDSYSTKFAADEVKNFASYIANLLDNGISTLIYAGDLDYICNYLGVRAVTLTLEWKHGDEFRSSHDRDWNNGGGLVRSSNGLTFLQVYDAGHMVPTDQPKQALDMISQFVKGGLV